MAFSTSGREVFPSARNVNNYYAQRSNKSKSKHTTFVWATEDAVASSVRSILFHGYLSSVFEQTVQRNRRSCRMFLQAHRLVKFSPIHGDNENSWNSLLLFSFSSHEKSPTQNFKVFAYFKIWQSKFLRRLFRATESQSPPSVERKMFLAPFMHPNPSPLHPC